MKKLLLSIGLVTLGFAASAQTVFNVDFPASIGGNYDFEYATSASWGVADLTIPANSVTDTIAFVSDGTVGDSLGCNALTNGVDINGKIAVVYRGDCEFGAKAKNAQDQGAVGVIIINNIPGPPVAMNGGTFGTQVTVPVVMVSDLTGELLANTVITDDVVVFIGNKIGRFPNDLSLYQKDVRRPVTYGNVSSLSQNASEFTTEMGAWVFNYGVHTQYNVELNCDVQFGGASIYNNFAMTDSIESGDSVYIGLPNFSQATYNNGYYTIEYVAVSDSMESLPSDNEVITGFVMNDTQISYGVIDSVTYEPIGDSYYRPSGTVGSFSMCVNYRNDNASRIAAKGITFSASTYNADDSTVNLVDEYIQIEAFKWEDNFTGITDATVDVLTQIGSGEYDYSSDLQRENVYVDFQEAFALEDNQRYLFCVKTESENVFLGYTTTIDYFSNQDTLDQPISMINSDGTLNLRGFGTDVTPAITIDTYVIDSDGDLVPDYVEIEEGTDANDNSDSLDSDGDGVPDYVEEQQGTDPNDANDFVDSDGDGIADYVIEMYVDSDGDLVPDFVEGQQGTDASNNSDFLDSDGDGVPDFVEGQQGTDANDANDFLDSDGDGVADYFIMLSLDENINNSLTAFPNPAKDLISIPVGNINVNEVMIYDVTGKVVSSQTVSNTNNLLKLDVSSIANGTYVVALNLDNGSVSKINVVISK